MDALVYANRWKRGETNIFVKNEKYGFNTFSKFILTKKLDAALVFMEWYNQCKNYDYNKEPLNNDESGNYVYSARYVYSTILELSYSELLIFFILKYIGAIYLSRFFF